MNRALPARRSRRSRRSPAWPGRRLATAEPPGPTKTVRLRTAYLTGDEMESTTHREAHARWVNSLQCPVSLHCVTPRARGPWRGPRAWQTATLYFGSWPPRRLRDATPPCTAAAQRWRGARARWPPTSPHPNSLGLGCIQPLWVIHRTLDVDGARAGGGLRGRGSKVRKNNIALSTVK